ncbi:solute carrier family 25 member 35-like [Onthophagus taurus]|uniref:solute carrier family 25 member 35-like n=1 Tax=Onthophagus taurus TaxID=166361 RepID=UPI000C203A67|nr:solute carrier family 25 member 35-like [Onthophagus taurus]XP_022918305.1 solute carrier family 25 member 35-like [Onthophagus taurus]XP_022918306.1 solute carrier family 25 member 35-like [Onthophagus taurus]
MEFAVGGLAAVGAGFFTNPLEVIKIRMQLQGELAAKGKYTTQYKNFVHAAYVIAKHDGIVALQSGLASALWFQFFLNGVRLGTYDVIAKMGFIRNKNGDLVLYKSVLASSFAGVVGSLAGSPFFLVKTHIQAQSSKEIAFGHQHNHESTIKAFVNIYKQQGIKGLFRGSTSSIPRGIVGSAAQLVSFDYAKQLLKKNDYFNNYPLLQIFMASMIGGINLTLLFTPFDLISTRLYNQGVDANGKGLLYSGYGDCVKKIFKSEGFLGFYKGIGPQYVRIGPHTVLCLVFWDELKMIHSKWKS